MLNFLSNYRVFYRPFWAICCSRIPRFGRKFWRQTSGCQKGNNFIHLWMKMPKCVRIKLITVLVTVRALIPNLTISSVKHATKSFLPNLIWVDMKEAWSILVKNAKRVFVLRELWQLTWRQSMGNWTYNALIAKKNFRIKQILSYMFRINQLIPLASAVLTSVMHMPWKAMCILLISAISVLFVEWNMNIWIFMLIVFTAIVANPNKFRFVYCVMCIPYFIVVR